MESAVALRLSGVQHQYDGQPLWKKPHELNCKAPTAIAITGPNGSGKSTLISILAGLLRPTRGQVQFFLNGMPTSPATWRSRVACLSPHLMPPADLTIEDLLWTYGRYKNLPRNTALLLKELHLYHRVKAPLYRFSSGQRQRLLLALTLSLSSPVLLLDEPTAFLDETWKALFHQQLKEIIQQGKTLIFCATNDPTEAALFPENLYLGAYAA